MDNKDNVIKYLMILLDHHINNYNMLKLYLLWVLFMMMGLHGWHYNYNVNKIIVQTKQQINIIVQ